MKQRSITFFLFLFGGEKNRTAINRKDAWVSSSYWADTGERIENDKVIDAWLTTDKKDFKI